MTASQYILSAIIIYVLYKTFQSYSRKKITKLFTFIWMVFWLTGLYVIFNPPITTKVSHMLGIGRGVDLTVYLSIILIFYVLFRLWVNQQDTERKITKIVREMSLKNKGKVN